MRELDEEEKKIRDSDRWYYKMFRTIAWGPTIHHDRVILIFVGISSR